MRTSKESYNRLSPQLTQRESDVLRLVVRSFIDTAGPIGSRFLVKNHPIGLSAASIRNTMSDLEDLGYLDHPYTSAGRVPTELGYRTFVDHLMRRSNLSDEDQGFLHAKLAQLEGQPQAYLKECSRLLGRLSNLLGVVLRPNLTTGVLERLEVVPLSSSRVMFVISLRGELVKTVVLEMDSELSRNDLEHVVRILNERLAGLTLKEIRETFADRTEDLQHDHTGLVKLVLTSRASLFSDQVDGRLSVAGTKNIVGQPEFLDQPEELKKLVELLEDENFIVQLLEEEGVDEPGYVNVRIGSEMSAEHVEKYSIVTATYQFGDTLGTIGVIGPTRMNYARVYALVEGVSNLLNRCIA